MEQKGVAIGKKAFFSSAGIIFVLMIVAGILTKLIPQGSFQRELLDDGRETIIPNSFTFNESATDLPFWRWFTAPIEVFLSSDAATVIVIILFILIIGGSVCAMDSAGMLKFGISNLVSKYEKNKYKLMAILMFCFMLLGSVLGIMEEAIALVPLIVALAYALKWDSLTGLGMSLLAVGFGFATATINPFTVGIAQSILGLPTFSGVLLRIPVFLITYGILYFFVSRYARKIEKNPKLSLVYEEDRSAREKYSGDDIKFENEPALKKALLCFGITTGVMLGTVAVGFFVPAISSISLPLMALIFLIGAVISVKVSKFKGGIFKTFLKGMLGVAPGGLLIVLAMSVKIIIENGGILDTILYYVGTSIDGTSPYVSALLIYAFVLIFNFFISSGSAKAFLVLPIIAPLTDIVGVTKQTTVSAFCFGDGFSNVLYPTNPLLLIALSLTVVSYPKWFRWTWKIQAIMALLSIAVLLFCVYIGYGPF